jgi:transposase-like protein
MRKNQRYPQAEMYAAIERCHQENISYAQYCIQAGIHYATFKYWTKKYHREQTTPEASFLPVQVTPEKNKAGFIITFPNGTRLECPPNIPISTITALLKV